jgi:hypothetical protein
MPPRSPRSPVWRVAPEGRNGDLPKRQQEPFLAEVLAGHGTQTASPSGARHNQAICVQTTEPAKEPIQANISAICYCRLLR